MWASMGEQTIGDLLRRLRIREGRSQAQQADKLSELAHREVTRHEVSRWEREKRLLTPFWQTHYAASFGIPTTQIREAVDAARAKRRRREDEPVHRRQFITVMAGLALPNSQGQPSRIGQADVDRLFRHTARLRRMDNFMGGGDTYGLYAQEAERTAHLITGTVHSEPVGRGLRSVFAEQAQLAGWAAFDAGDHAQARRHYRASLTAAEEAQDGALVSCVRNS